MARLRKTKRYLSSRSKESPDIPLNWAEIESIDSLSEQLLELKNEFKDQRNENKNIIFAVVIALVFIVVTVAIEVIFYHSSSDGEILEFKNQYFQEIQKVREDIIQMKMEI